MRVSRCIRDPRIPRHTPARDRRALNQPGVQPDIHWMSGCRTRGDRAMNGYPVRFDRAEIKRRPWRVVRFIGFHRTHAFQACDLLSSR